MSRNQKQTKLMTLELIDYTGMIIEGVMFGDGAREKHD